MTDSFIFHAASSQWLMHTGVLVPAAVVACAQDGSKYQLLWKQQQ
jgi:hypothetical protein